MVFQPPRPSGEIFSVCAGIRGTLSESEVVAPEANPFGSMADASEPPADMSVDTGSASNVAMAEAASTGAATIITAFTLAHYRLCHIK